MSRQYPRFVLREVCPHCERGKKGTYEGDGKLYCSRCGHHLEQYRPIVDDEINPFGLRIADHRASANDDGGIVLTKAERRAQAKRGYLMVFQLLLMQHCLFLIREKGLPKELEVVTRDLWALWQSHYPYTTFPDHETRENRDRAGSVAPSDSGRSTTGLSSRASSAAPSGISSQMSSGQSDSELSDRKSSTGARRYRSRVGEDLGNRPSIIHTLSLLYIACRLLRLPVRLGDINMWVENGQLWHNSLVATLSKDQLQYLDSSHISSVQTAPSLNPEKLFKRSVSLDMAFHRRFGIVLPSLNWTLLSYRYITDMLLPIEMYPMISTLLQSLHTDLAVHSNQLAERRFRMVYLPDAQLIAVFIVAAKILFPPDGLERYILKDDGQTIRPAPSFDWTVWLEMVRKHSARAVGNKAFTTRDAERLSEEYIWNKMSVSEMDKYMDWFEDTFVTKGGAGAGVGVDGDDSGGNGSVPATDGASSSNEPFQMGGDVGVFDRLFDVKLQISSSREQSRDVVDLVPESEELIAVMSTFGSNRLDPHNDDAADSDGSDGNPDGRDSNSTTSETPATSAPGPSSPSSRRNSSSHTRQRSEPAETEPEPRPESPPGPKLLLGQKYRVFRTMDDLGFDSASHFQDEGESRDNGDDDNDDDSQPDSGTNVGNGATKSVHVRRGSDADGDDTDDDDDDDGTRSTSRARYNNAEFELRCYRELYSQASIHSGVPIRVIVTAVAALDFRLIRLAKERQRRDEVDDRRRRRRRKRRQVRRDGMVDRRGGKGKETVVIGDELRGGRGGGGASDSEEYDPDDRGDDMTDGDLSDDIMVQ